MAVSVTLRRCLLALALALPSPLLLAGDWHVALGIMDRGASQPGGLTAFNEDVAREICRRVRVHCVTVNLPFGEILEGLAEGRYAMGFGNFLRTGEREKRIAFSVPLWHSSSRLIARADVQRRLSDTTLDSLQRLRVTAVPGTQQHAYWQSVAASRDLVVVPAGSMGEIIGMLRRGQADVALVPVLSAYALLAGEATGEFAFVGPPAADRGLGGGVHVGLPKGNESLRKTVDKALVEMRADGTLHRIVRRHFNFSLD